MNEGAETALFKQNFTNWRNKDETTSLIKSPKRTEGKASVIFASKDEELFSPAKPQEKFDVSAMQKKGRREEQVLVDDGTGKVEIWRIEDFEMQPLEKGLYGQFFGGDSYVILYTYLVNGKENYIVYFWLGQVTTHSQLDPERVL